MQFTARTLAFVFLSAATVLTPIPAPGATITRNGDRIVLTGTIQPGDDTAFAASVDDNVRTVVLGSSGGRVDEAMSIGRLIRERGLDTAVPSLCESACVLIWVGGKTRTVEGKLVVHCPTLRDSPYQCDAAGRQQMLAYLREMSAPPGLLTEQFAVNWMAREVPAAQLAQERRSEPRVAQTSEDWRLSLPEPGFLYEPWRQRAIPCLPTLLTLGMLRFCI